MKVITIGRSRENNNIKIDDEKVSRNHLQIVQDDNGNYTVMDLGSTNGTFVNGQRIQRSAQLNPGDILKIGNSTLPWQSYFSSEGGAGIPNPPSIHNDKDNQDINDPIPFYRRWWTWIAVVVILLIIIGCVVWSAGSSSSSNEIPESPVEQPEPLDPETEYYKAQTEYAEAQSEADRAAKEVAEKQAAVDRAQAEADRAAKQAAETKSREDQKKAEAKAIEAEKANLRARGKAFRDVISFDRIYELYMHPEAWVYDKQLLELIGQDSQVYPVKVKKNAIQKILKEELF